jgi:hypothetical protein
MPKTGVKSFSFSARRSRRGRRTVFSKLKETEIPSPGWSSKKVRVNKLECARQTSPSSEIASVVRIIE